MLDLFPVLQSGVALDGGFLAGAGVGLGAASAGVSFAVKTFRSGGNGAGHDGEFRGEIRTLIRQDHALTERVVDTQERLARTVEALAETVRTVAATVHEHDQRTTRAVRLVEEIHAEVMKGAA